MKSRHKRLAFVVVGMVGLAAAATLVFNALEEGMALFISPTDLLAGKAPQNKAFRLGGMVVDGSLQRENDGLTVHFKVTDSAETVPVTFTGILPDLFREGQGVVAQGRLDPKGVFQAEEVLAKHDENYMPPEVADALEKAKAKNAADAASMTSTTPSGMPINMTKPMSTTTNENAMGEIAK